MKRNLYTRRCLIYLVCIVLIYNLFIHFHKDEIFIWNNKVQEKFENFTEPQDDYVDTNNINAVKFSKNHEILNKNFPKNYIDKTLNNGNIIRWNSSTFPLKVYISNSSDIPQYFYNEVELAFKEWQAASDNLITFKFVDSSKNADIRCIFPQDYIAEKYEDHSTAGLTKMHFENDIIKYVEITLSPKNTNGEFYKEENVFSIAVHEIGHALGIHGHSLNKEDVMYPVASTGKISTGDINTLKLLYSIVPDISNKNFTNEEKAKYMTVADIFGDYDDRINMELSNVKEDNSKLYSQSFTKYLHIGDLYYQKKDYTKAIKNYELAMGNLKDEKYLSKINYKLSKCYFDMEDYTKALKFSQISYKQNQDEETLLLIGLIYMKTNNFDEAKKCFISIIDKNPKKYNAYIYLGKIYYEEQNQEDMKVLYELGNANFPENPPIKYVQTK